MKASFSFNRRFEVRFDSIPSYSIRHGLKDHGFWWDSEAKCWWLAKPVNMREIRKEPVIRDGFKDALEHCRFYLGLTQEQSEAIARANAEQIEQAAVAGMLEANGII